MSNRSNGKGVDLQAQTAVVTGGGRGIGRAIALALAEAGARVAVLSRTHGEVAETAGTIEEAGGRAQAYLADVTDAPAIRAAVARIEQSLGGVDVWVNNAAQAGPIRPFEETEVDEWWRTMEVNLRGPVLCTRTVLPGMIARRRGRIINIVSSAIPIPYFSSYSTGKTALVRFTETIAEETKRHGIRMFALGPGTVRTAMSEHSLYSLEGQKWLPWFGRIFERGLDVPAERAAQYVVKLASGRADRLTGRFLSIFDDLDVLLGGMAEIEANDLYSLRVRKLEGTGAAPALTAIHAEAMKAATQ